MKNHTLLGVLAAFILGIAGVAPVISAADRGDLERASRDAAMFVNVAGDSTVFFLDSITASPDGGIIGAGQAAAKALVMKLSAGRPDVKTGSVSFIRAGPA